MATLNSTISIEGEDKILLRFKEFISDTESAAGPILQEGAQILKSAAKELAPVSRHGLRIGKYAHPPGTLKSSIDVGTIRHGKGYISMAVGIAENQYFTQGNQNQWYARWVEFGTKERTVNNYFGHRGIRKYVGVMMARPFMRPALVRNRAKIRKLIADRLKGALFHD